jgi:hypothetical protein
MAFFHGYFDESGKHQEHKVVSFCGFLDADWTAFENEWEYLLRKNKIPALHVSAGSLKSTSTALNLYRQFIQAIRKHVEHGFGVAVDVAGFNATNKVKQEYGGDAHYCAFSTAIRDVVKYVQSIPDSRVAIVCDDDPEKACTCYKMFDRMRQNVKQPENRKILKSIAFADDEAYPQLQAADLFSWVSRAESLYRFHGQDYSLRELYSEFVFDFPGFKTEFTTPFWDAAHLKEVEANVVAVLSRKKR